MRRYLIPLGALAGVMLLFVITASAATAQSETRVKRVKMKIDGYLCGN